ncbi:uncharacterized protein LOC122886655 isoform X1 [Siniperca chuatsi]|uniref:uncharacterized protein LOC122886655 isoform X1 n=1 Tax=Siniperca chuatsi TaxID=119488 RepID=UPI001CE1EED7|nr:uncharacterized protein LOC122886655 isoform X1 [Siniperca chuatsi]
MHFLGILVLMFCDLSLSFPLPVDTIIVQVQQWGVVGTQRVVDQVLLNGVALTGTSQEVDHIIKNMSADALPPALITVNQASVLSKKIIMYCQMLCLLTASLGNHTVLRSRECILEGSQLHWNDRVFYDGKVYLTLDHTDVWTAHVPQALALKVLWGQEVQRTRTDRIRLQEECIKLMRELRLSEEQSGTSFLQFMIPVLALLAFTGLIIISLLLSKHQGLRHPGGVVGSIVHYPKNMTEMAPEIKGCGYHTL